MKDYTKGWLQDFANFVPKKINMFDEKYERNKFYYADLSILIVLQNDKTRTSVQTANTHRFKVQRRKVTLMSAFNIRYSKRVDLLHCNFMQNAIYRNKLCFLHGCYRCCQLASPHLPPKHVSWKILVTCYLLMSGL